MTTRHKVVLDTDPGIDDALAILLGLASPEIELLGLSIVGGNCPLAEGVANALGVLALGGAAHVPVAAGVALPLLRPAFTATKIHGVSGLGYAQLPPTSAGPVAEHGVDLLIREVMAAPGEVTVVAIGPLTNLALALRKEPRIAAAVREVIIMGGAFRVDGNASPLAEFNIYVDPHAAQMVFMSGMPLLIMPWDITRNVKLYPADIERLLHVGGPIVRLIADATRFYIEAHELNYGFAACSVNDPAALVLAFLPELARVRPVHITVETASELTMGATVADFRGFTGQSANARLVVDFDTPRFIALLLERLEQLARR